MGQEFAFLGLENDPVVAGGGGLHGEAVRLQVLLDLRLQGRQVDMLALELQGLLTYQLGSSRAVGASMAAHHSERPRMECSPWRLPVPSGVVVSARFRDRLRCGSGRQAVQAVRFSGSTGDRRLSTREIRRQVPAPG